MSIDGPEIGTLVVIVDRAKNLPNRKTIGKQDPYCAARLGKEAQKTKTDIRGGQTPKWDQELRFKVHDCPDYFQLKLSVFNDDKKTDLIGETWIDLRDIIVPGGGQSDQWQSLSCKGKYAGEVRIEITYYDNRPKPEKPAAKEKLVASSTELDGNSSIAQRSPVKRRPLPSNPGTPAIDHGPSPKAVPDHAQTPPKHKSNAPITSFIPNQSPLQAVEYNSPPPNHFAYSDQHSPGLEDGGAYGASPHAPRQEHQYHHSVDRNDKFTAYEDDPRYHTDPYSQPFEPEPRAAYSHGQPTHYMQAAPPHQRQPVEDDDRPPPPPVHRVRNNSGNSHETLHRGSFDSLQHKPTPPMPMRHDVLRSEAHRNSLPAQPSSSSSNYPGRPVYRPFDSAPDVPKELAYEEPSPPRHHSYDSAYDPHYRSMQPTVEDVPESWTPPNARSRRSTAHQEPYDEMGYNQVPSPAPLNLSGRGSAASGHYSPSPVQTPSHSHRSYGSNDMSISPGAIVPRDYSRSNPGHAYSYSGNSDPYASDPYTSQANEYENSLVLHRSSTNYAPPPPPVPSTLIPGVDPGLALELASCFHAERKQERRYTQPAPMPASSRGRQHSEPPNNYAIQPSPHGHHSSSSSRNYGGSPIVYGGCQSIPSGRGPSPAPAPVAHPRGLSPVPNPNHTIRRKSVSPAPPPVESRRLSGVPFGPDDYDALNPSVAPKSNEYTNVYGKIITADGREVDPSDHLPMDTWAPEPEPKQPKPKPDEEPQFNPSPVSAQPIPVSGRRQLRIQMRPQSMAPTYTSSDVDPLPPPVSTGRNRLQKKAHRMSALPAPAAPISPLGPATSHQRNSTPPRALVRASTFDYENHGPYSTSPGASYGSYGGGGPPPIPAKIPLMSGGLGPGSGSSGGRGGGDDEWALMQEMSRIDIGTARSRRHGGY